MNIDEILHRLKFLISPTGFKTLINKLHNKTDEEKTEIIYPFIRQYGKRIDLKKKTMHVDKLGKRFKIDSPLGKILSKKFEDIEDYDEKLDKIIKRGIKFDLIDEINIYAIWIDKKIYYLYGDRFGERESGKELVNDWKIVNLEQYGFKQYNFTLRDRAECEYFVETYKEKIEDFPNKFVEYLL